MVKIPKYLISNHSYRPISIEDVTWSDREYLDSRIKERMEELKENEERYRHLFDNSEVSTCNEDFAEDYNAPAASRIG